MFRDSHPRCRARSNCAPLLDCLEDRRLLSGVGVSSASEASTGDGRIQPVIVHEVGLVTVSVGPARGIVAAAGRDSSGTDATAAGVVRSPGFKGGGRSGNKLDRGGDPAAASSAFGANSRSGSLGTTASIDAAPAGSTSKSRGGREATDAASQAAADGFEQASSAVALSLSAAQSELKPSSEAGSGSGGSTAGSAEPPIGRSATNAQNVVPEGEGSTASNASETTAEVVAASSESSIQTVARRSDSRAHRRVERAIRILDRDSPAQFASDPRGGDRSRTADILTGFFQVESEGFARSIDQILSALDGFDRDSSAAVWAAGLVTKALIVGLASGSVEAARRRLNRGSRPSGESSSRRGSYNEDPAWFPGLPGCPPGWRLEES